MATSIFIDPLNGTDAAGKGAIGDPYKSTSYALRNHTHSSFPVYVNVRDTTPDIITENLCSALAQYHTNSGKINSSTQQVIFRGYSNTENDGGKGVLDGDGTYPIFAVLTRSSPYLYRYVSFLDLEIRNSGSERLIDLDYYSIISRCIFHNCTNQYPVYAYPYSSAYDCYMYNCGDGSNGYGLLCHNITKCFCYNFGPNYAKYPIYARNGAFNNIVVTDRSNGGGIYCTYDGTICNNTVLALNPSSSNGIVLAGTNGRAYNNIIVGFSDGGYAIYGGSTSYNYDCIGNSYYNCTTTLYRVDTFNTYNRGNEELDSDPLARVGNPTCENRFNYFEPLDVGSVWNGSFPFGSRIDRGAVQHKDNVYVVF